MAQQSKSLLAKYGKELKAAHEECKDQDTEYSMFGELPAGIENGIAQLVEAKFGEYEKGDLQGESFLYMAGVVLIPKEHAGVPIEGLRTSIMEPLCETPTRTRTTVKEHLAHIYNELRKLGVNTATLRLEDLEATVEALKGAQPTFRFRTWKGKPQTTGEYAGVEPRTQHSWNGVCDYTPDEGDDGVEDDTPTPAPKAPKPSSKPAAAAKTPPKAAAAATKTAPAKVAPKPGPKVKAPEPEEPFDDGAEDLNALAELADAGDEEAKDKLTELAEAQGITVEQIEATTEWAEVVALINGEELPEKEEDEDNWVPEKDGIYGYCPPNPKTKKPGKQVQVMVLTINEAKKVVTVKNMVDGKTKYVVDFDKLEQAD